MDLKQIYRDYIDCLNEQAWSRLGKFVADEVVHNNNPLGLSGYREMLEQDYAAIPDLRFNVEMMISEYPHLGSRLRFDCSPAGVFLGLPVNGRRVSFHENVFYEFDNNKIMRVRSVIDKAALEAQL
jgi:predicted ester cyclase